ncbi:(2Fe-2S)-binding protein [Candidatus Izimaplasma sp. ZiA1]|uniref:(2Fe-2S)-binding protein n=1 Tax=Candidatus Izimoplasma sp. ZiA1 TaxID=2024899 RepID=UPI0014394DE3
MDKYEAYNNIKREQAIKDGVICVCKQVTERKIRKAVKGGAKRFISVKRETEAASGCGLCRPLVEDIMNDELKKA